MAVLTTDILLEGVRREAAFDWLGEPANHLRILQNAFDSVQDNGDGRLSLTFAAPAFRTRILGYRFEKKDDSHGGRRVLIATDGKRTTGKLHYSLRTMKPSTNTLVTLHMDYQPGDLLGQLIDAVALREALEQRWATVLADLKALAEGDQRAS